MDDDTFPPRHPRDNYLVHKVPGGECSIETCFETATTIKTLYHYDGHQRVATRWPACERHGDEVSTK